MSIHTDRETLALALRTYGEDELAARVASMSAGDLHRVFDRADDYLHQDESGLIARALAGAAVEVLVGEARPLSRSRRRLKGVLPPPVPCPEPPADPEAPRDVFAAAAARIAARFEPDGWRYARSGPRLSHAEGPFTFQLHLTTSAYNARGEFVGLDAAALIRSRALKRWRHEQRVVAGHEDSVAAGLLHNLADGPILFRWNLANPDTRDEVIADCVEQIERLALPWFATFTDREALIERLRTARLANISPEDAIDVLVWLGHREAAEAHARARLAEHPEIARTYEQERLRLSGQTDLGASEGNLGEDVARAVHAHGLSP